MTCTDPEAARRLLEEGAIEASGWQAHIAECDSCRGFSGGLTTVAAEDAIETHPAGAALRAFDEEPASLSPKIREWIAAHLAACASCAGALAAVPALPLRRPRVWLRPWPLAAAAGWLLVAVLVLRDTQDGPPGAAALLPTHSLVLTTVRGSDPAPIPSGARILRLHLVLPEDVLLGQVLRIHLRDAAGRTVLEQEARVDERDEREWPVLTLDRTGLPSGPLRLQVICPSGATTTFDLSLP